MHWQNRNFPTSGLKQISCLFEYELLTVCLSLTNACNCIVQLDVQTFKYLSVVGSSYVFSEFTLVVNKHYNMTQA